ncbi:class F sortase [Metabacillus iocasae]|uniref:LPXTG-site transpeptidase (Sortase) family protein n=1 Tax=Priestia iocasae TaxID=2291674 RepID=A0ABS2QUI0_9BACI|nr:class F sortase [Metabacillus iocasae]MBM7703140.1 LPXTG-site transpeptidase (sortase) family protein [Metabacillus iocasae]
MTKTRWIATFSTFAIIGLVGCTHQATSTVQSEPTIQQANMVETQPTSKSNSSSAAESIDVSTPSQLSIPKLNIQAPIEETGLTKDGQMGVPDDGETVAWFEPGTIPGREGNAVLAGHVDDKKGPAIFYHLGKLETGDELFVSDENGNVLTFVVKTKQAYPRDKAPIRDIFGPTYNRQLNLITCTGLFDRKKGTHEERLVVYTELKETRATASN